MKEKSKRPTYEPPRARDLSAHSVSGFPVPQGICLGGGALVYPGYCRDGDVPDDTVTGVCDPNGVSPDFGYCDVGNVAIEGCKSGGVHG